MRHTSGGLAALVPALLLAAGCSRSPAASEASARTDGVPQTGPTRTLTLGGYTTPREVYGDLLVPAFKQQRAAKGETLRVEASYLGSGAQARAIVSGFEADVAALSLEPDIEKIRAAGLITSDWKAAAKNGMVSRSIVVIGVRAGNPKNIHTWEDLARDDVSVLTPNVKMSGGAMWNVTAIVGAALRGKTKAPAHDPQAAQALLASILSRVTIMDKGGRESMLTFENGTGDAIITYENEVIEAKRAGKAVDVVVPPSTVLIENPIAVVDRVATKRGNQTLAADFIAFLVTPEAQRAFASRGYRPIDESIALDPGMFTAPNDLFTVADLGGWKTLQHDLFDDGALYDRAITSRKTEP